MKRKFQAVCIGLALLLSTGSVPAALVTETYTFNVTPPDGDIADYENPPKVFLQTVSASQIATVTKVEVRLKLAGNPPGSGFASEMFVSLNKNFDVSAVLLNRVGVTADNALGAFYDGWDVTFTDDAAADVHFADTADGTGVLTGTWQPDGRTDPTESQRPQLLAGFNGQPGNGAWRLAIGDLEFGGIMRLESWELVLTGNTAPEIEVEQPIGIGLTAGSSSVGFGNINLGDSSGAKTFTIKNTGTDDLTNIAVSIDGVNSADFAVNTSGMSTTVTPGNSTTFTVTFTPGASGMRSATLHIASNDADENPFDIALSGNGLSAAESWRQFYFGTTANTGDAANGADPDGDGFANVLEFAFGTNPIAGGLGAISVNGGVITPGSPTTLVVTNPDLSQSFFALFGRRKDYVAAGLTYTVQFTTDFVTWTDSADTPTVLADDGTLQAVTVPYPFTQVAQPNQFFRVVVSLPQAYFRPPAAAPVNRRR